jgi:hypothetical protein
MAHGGIKVTTVKNTAATTNEAVVALIVCKSDIDLRIPPSRAVLRYRPMGPAVWFWTNTPSASGHGVNKPIDVPLALPANINMRELARCVFDMGQGRIRDLDRMSRRS